MKKELHLKIGDKKLFEKTLKKLGVEKKFNPPIYTSLCGLNVIESNLVPKDKAFLIGKNGELLQVFNLTD